MPERNTGVAADNRIELRIGINLGDVIVEGDDLDSCGCTEFATSAPMRVFCRPSVRQCRGQTELGRHRLQASVACPELAARG